MKILVSNDDGINAPGIHAMAKALSSIGEVTVVAPALQQTAKGHSLTFGGELRAQKRPFEEGIEAYAVWGTPKDCVDLAVEALLDFTPDLIVTGINEGPNICNDAVSSGTIGGAVAGYNKHIPSIAASLDFGDIYDYEKCAPVVAQVASWFARQPYNREFALSINFPNTLEPFKGITVAESGGKHIFDMQYEKVREDEDSVYYFVRGGKLRLENIVEDLDHDIYALQQGYVVLTPVNDDLVHTDYLDTVRKDWNNR